MTRNAIDYKFVEFIPSELDEGTLYISTEYATAAHKCCCGCGNRVVTPLSPTDWEVIFDGRSISLEPSIGNWSFPCRSHYWIKKNHVIWARQWSQEEVDHRRAYDRQAKAAFESGESTDEVGGSREKRKLPIWRSLRRRMQKWFGKTSSN